MRYKTFKTLANALLIHDITLTTDEDELLALLEYALYKVAMGADSQHLLVEDLEHYTILREINEFEYIRKPELPKDEDEELDIDDTLAYAVVRYVCSFVTTAKTRASLGPSYHEKAAEDIIRDYNQELYAFKEKQEQYGELEEFESDDQYSGRLI